MVISLSNTVTHPAACSKNIDSNDQKVKEVVLERFQKLGLTSEDIAWNKQGHLEVKNPDALKLHTLMLQMEELGLDLKMTKQTLIEVC